ncbi:heavy metal translocating P-type ATPase [Listeria booriae]|uniref:Probable cadmium-transporting ATPase n=1 Tax=Listeria booriae TaxID=1552123 RepID=A0A7X0XQ84_9LIST|nr:heavy metal translocating P-type ATPase [Listeria booriae]MBC1778221.1 cadmium-translocating P-type ATPase [Listeria booriae]
MLFVKRNIELLAACISGLLILLGWILPVTAMTPIIFISAFIIGGFAKAREGILSTWQTHKLNVELLMILAAIGASIIGYWLEGAVLIFIFSLSGALETYTTNKSKREITNLLEIQPVTAFLRRADNTVEEVPVESLQLGDSLLVRPGDTIPIDGEIVSGTSNIDESAISGEPVPIEKQAPDTVYAGTANLNGALTIKVTQTAENTLFHKIIQLVQQAQDKPSTTARFIEKFEDAYVKIVLLFVGVMLFLPHFIFGWDWTETFYRAMVLLVVASPCALVASVTPATLAAISNGARNGVLFKGGIYLERLQSIPAIAFDKTGTLTQGKPSVTDITLHKTIDPAIIATIENQSTHPLAQSIVKALDAKLLPDIDVINVPGYGVKSQYRNQEWRIGKADFVGRTAATSFLEEHNPALSNQGKTLVFVSRDQEVVGLFALKDIPQTAAKTTIDELHHMGIQTIMITGDSKQTADTIAEELGIDTVIADCLPENKVNHILALQKKHGSVAMLGDGINDAPALANADVGIAMGEGTDVAIETADVILMKNDLSKLAFVVKLSKRLHRITWQNIIFSMCVIFLLILSNFFQLINLPFGVIGHEGSTILVILNGLRLLR